MQIFYAPGIEGGSYTLDEKESKHCIRVLRMTKGTAVKLIDGKGNLYEGIISSPDSKKCIIGITGIISDFEKRNYRLHIAISPLKNPERFEWFAEKSVEIGIDEITPLICKNTEKQSIKPERINNIIISAMKQSLKAGITILNEAVYFEDFIKKDFPGKKLIGHCNHTEGVRKKIDLEYTKGNDAVILIGPEGDFTISEINKAKIAGYKPITLGNSRLRTETAGIAACHSIYFLNR
ncbi:MAG: 16S rRNA (uracil(1498)-N(3))-methyltransferase [Odoribacter sp.]|nr:16S rRNA (uracil(1498)-N(3))-methyltransferase [Odoribacter sp.]